MKPLLERTATVCQKQTHTKQLEDCALTQEKGNRGVEVGGRPNDSLTHIHGNRAKEYEHEFTS
jgi:hypothetical protein